MNLYSFEFIAHQVTWSEGLEVAVPAIAFRYFDFPSLVIYRDRKGNFGNGKRVKFEMLETDLDISLKNRSLFVMLVQVQLKDQPAIVASSKVNLSVFRGDLPYGKKRRNIISLFNQEGALIANLDGSIALKLETNTTVEQVQKNQQQVTRLKRLVEEPVLREKRETRIVETPLIDESEVVPTRDLESEQVMKEEEEIKENEGIIEERIVVPVQTRARKPGKTLEDVVNANYCPPALWFEKKEVQRVPEIKRSTELVSIKPVQTTVPRKKSVSKLEGAVQVSREADSSSAAIPTNQRVETLLLELLLMMRRGQIPTRESGELPQLYSQLGAVGRRASFTKQQSEEYARPSTPEYSAKRRSSITKHHVIGAMSSGGVTPKVGGKEVSFSPPQKMKENKGENRGKDKMQREVSKKEETMKSKKEGKIMIRVDSPDHIPTSLQPKPIGAGLSKDHRRFEEESMPAQSLQTQFEEISSAGKQLDIPKKFQALDKSLTASQIYSEDFEEESSLGAKHSSYQSSSLVKKIQSKVNRKQQSAANRKNYEKLKQQLKSKSQLEQSIPEEVFNAEFNQPSQKESNMSINESTASKGLGGSKILASSGTYSDIDQQSESAGSYDRLVMCFLCKKQIMLSQFKKHSQECDQIRQSNSGLDETYKDDFEEETQQF